MTREEIELILEPLDELHSKVGQVEVEDILHHIVAIGVLNKLKCVVLDLSNQLLLLVEGGMVDTPLEDTTAMAMSGDLERVNMIELDRIVKGKKDRT